MYRFDMEKDLAGNARLYENRIDIGVYEYNPLGTGNEISAALPDGITVWTQQSRLYIRSKIPVKMNVYTVSGLLFRRLELQANETVVLSLERNVYFVVPDNHKARKVFVF